MLMLPLLRRVVVVVADVLVAADVNLVRVVNLAVAVAEPDVVLEEEDKYLVLQIFSIYIYYNG